MAGMFTVAQPSSLERSLRWLAVVAHLFVESRLLCCCSKSMRLDLLLRLLLLLLHVCEQGLQLLCYCGWHHQQWRCILQQLPAAQHRVQAAPLLRQAAAWQLQPAIEPSPP
jgi:hypothetical protein